METLYDCLDKDEKVEAIVFETYPEGSQFYEGYDAVQILQTVHKASNSIDEFHQSFVLWTNKHIYFMVECAQGGRLLDHIPRNPVKKFPDGMVG